MDGAGGVIERAERRVDGAALRASVTSSQFAKKPTSAMGVNATIRFGREICGSLEEAEAREWLVTNGMGGYASGTIAGGMARRYQGLLVAALQPPVGRTQL